MNPKPQLCGLVLAGGRSSRMGSDKAVLLHPDGRTLARRTCDLLREAGCEKVVLSLRHDQEIPEGFAGFENLTIVRDPAEGSVGPVAGMVGGPIGLERRDRLADAAVDERLEREVGELAAVRDAIGAPKDLPLIVADDDKPERPKRTVVRCPLRDPGRAHPSLHGRSGRREVLGSGREALSEQVQQGLRHGALGLVGRQGRGRGQQRRGAGGA